MTKLKPKFGRARSPWTPTSDGNLMPAGGSTPYLIRQTNRLFIRAIERRINRHGITIGMWFFLRVLWEEDGITQSELGERVSVVGPTTVTAMTRMERMGLIERRKSQTDKRLSYIFLTPKGRSLKDDLLPYSREVFDAGLQSLSAAEREQLHALLTRVHASLLHDSDAEGQRELA